MNVLKVCVSEWGKSSTPYATIWDESHAMRTSVSMGLGERDGAVANSWALEPNGPDSNPSFIPSYLCTQGQVSVPQFLHL